MPDSGIIISDALPTVIFLSVPSKLVYV